MVEKHTDVSFNFQDHLFGGVRTTSRNCRQSANMKPVLHRCPQQPVDRRGPRRREVCGCHHPRRGRRPGTANFPLTNCIVLIWGHRNGVLERFARSRGSCACAKSLALSETCALASSPPILWSTRRPSSLRFAVVSTLTSFANSPAAYTLETEKRMREMARLWTLSLTVSRRLSASCD